MIQLNLLPEVKQQYINAQRQRRMLSSLSVLVAGASLIILILLFGYNLALKAHLHSLNNDIATNTQQLKSEPKINTILTVQNQLNSLPALDANKPEASKLFQTYLNELTPSNVSISDFNINFAEKTMSIEGSADSLSSINQYVDTFKKTTYTIGTSKATTPAFSDVVLSEFGINSSSAGNPTQAASYTITLDYNQAIFDESYAVTLNVPSITTRADVNVPTTLFEAAPTTTKTTSGGGS
jgi:hypothetical protein